LIKLEEGKCLKCQAVIIHDKKPTGNWTQKGYKTLDGNILFVGLCKSCHLVPEDFEEASRVVGAQSPIVEEAKRGRGRMQDTLSDVLRDSQGGKCFACGKELGEHYAISGGHITCERC
jgi:hypothetical protein